MRGPRCDEENPFSSISIPITRSGLFFETVSGRMHRVCIVALGFEVFLNNSRIIKFEYVTSIEPTHNCYIIASEMTEQGEGPPPSCFFNIALWEDVLVGDGEPGQLPPFARPPQRPATDSSKGCWEECRRVPSPITWGSPSQQQRR